MLSLVSGRDPVVNLTPVQGTGWQNAQNGTNNYVLRPLRAPGWYELTVTAHSCAGVRIIDWDKSQTANIDSSSTSTSHSLTAVVNYANFGPVVRVNNPTETTEVHMSYRRLSPL